MKHIVTHRTRGVRWSRRVRCVFALVVILWCATSAAQVVPAQPSLPVRLTVDAACSDPGAFLAELKRHSPRVRGASDAEPSRSLTVAVRRDGEQVVGALTVRDLGENEGHREVRGQDCSSVVAGLAFVAALTIDPDAASQAPPALASPAGTPVGPETLPTSIAAAGSDSGTHSPSPGNSELAPARSFGIAAGAAIEAARGLGPDTALLPRLFLDLEFGRLLGGAHARLSGGRGITRVVATNVGNASIDVADVRLDACIDAWSRASFQLASCGLVDGVVLAGEGKNTQGPESANRLSIELGVALRPRWIVEDWISLELAAGASAPLTRYRFYFAPPDTTAYRLAAVSAFAEFAAGVRFR
jgi:hypothetical protein